MAVRLILAAVLFPLVLAGESAVIPRPAAEETGTGRVVFNATYCIVCEDPSLARVAARTIGFWTGIKLDAGPKKLPRARLIRVTGRSRAADIAELGREGYRLEVLRSGEVRIAAADPAGAFYGLQTLVQLFENNGRGDWELPVVRIEDAPRFAWRGVLLEDTARFAGKDKVKKLLNVMALYKLNTLHWRLADDAHWRVGSRVVPALADAEENYSPEEIRELVAYAAERHIRIVPGLAVKRAAEKVFSASMDQGIAAADREKRWTALWEEMARLFSGDYFQLARRNNGAEEKHARQTWAVLRQQGKQPLADGMPRSGESPENPAVRMLPVSSAPIPALAHSGAPVLWTGGAAEAEALVVRTNESGPATYGGMVRLAYAPGVPDETTERAFFPAALRWAEALWTPAARNTRGSFAGRWRRGTRFLERLRVAHAAEENAETVEEISAAASKNAASL